MKINNFEAAERCGKNKHTKYIMRKILSKLRDEILSKSRNVKQRQNLKSKLSRQSRLLRDTILNIVYKTDQFMIC